MQTNTSISTGNRFETLLDEVHEIGSSLAPDEIFQRTQAAGKKLLGNRSVVILTAELETGIVEVIGGHVHDYDNDLVNEVLTIERTVVREQEKVRHSRNMGIHNGTYLCSPIAVHGKTIGCLYVADEITKRPFGPDEIRIAEYVTSAAGAALERADRFRRLEKINVNLELARDKAESASEAKSQFLAHMSHEIRTPIAAILGFTELILRGVVNDPDDQKQKLKTIHSSAEHLLRLVNDVLDSSKIEANKIDAEIIDCFPMHIVQNVVDSLQPTAVQKSIGLKVQVIGDVPTVIQSDPTRLRQILTNLIGNAIKFTDHGSVSVTTRMIEEERIAFEIRDEGIGMDAETQRRIFEPFTQADSSTTRKFGGTGLGLSISKRLAEILDGTIRFESQLGKGSTFVIEISAGKLSGSEIQISGERSVEPSSEEPAAEHFVDDNSRFSGRRIMVVDDAITNRELLTLILEDVGVEIELAENGQQAFERLHGSETEFDIVLMDMQMPVLDGYSAASQLRKSGYKQPIIALTANTMTGDEDRCLDVGCTDYLSKPIIVGTLLSKIQSLLGATHAN